MRMRAMGIVGVALLLLLAPATARAASYSFTPTADAYVTSKSPNANFGTTTDLRADGNPTVRSYLRFTPTGLTGPIRLATLRLYATNGSTVGYQVRGVPGNPSFGETTITYNNAPAVAATATGSSGAYAAGWTAVNITALVTGAVPITIAVTTTSAGGRLNFSSRQLAAQAPKLDIVTDTTPPVVTLTAPANASSISNTMPVFSGAAGTDVGDSSTVTVKVYSGPSATGVPVQTLNTTRSGNAYSVTAAAPLLDGTYTAQAQQSDDGGLTGFSSANTFVVDSAAPAVTLTEPADGSSTSSSTPTFAGTAGTASGDSATVTVKVYAGTSATGTPVQTRTATRSGSSWSIAASPALADGVYTAQAEQGDTAGNVGRSAPSTFTVDGAAPIVTLTAPANGSAVATATPTFSGAAGTAPGDATTVLAKIYAGPTPTGTPVQTLSASVVGGSWTAPASGPLADGVYTAQAEQSDAAGHLGLSAASTFTVDTQPPPAPAIDSGPSDPSTSTGASFSFSDTEAGVGYRCRVDGGAPSACTSPAGYSALADGAHVFGVTARDAAGNESAETQWSWTIDSSAPAVTVTAPSDGSGSTDTTPHFAGAAGTAPGDGDAMTVTIYPGPTPTGTPVQTLSTSRSGAAWGVDASAPLADGTYTAEAAQADLAGNVGRATSTFTVDNTAPVVTLTAPANGSTVAAAPVFSGGAGTAPWDAGTVTVRVYPGPSATGTPVQTLTATRSGASWSVPASGPLADGLYTAQAEQADSLGHVGQSNANTFTVDTTDTTPPVVTLTTPAGGAIVNQRTPTFAGTAGDVPGDSTTVTVKVYAGSSATGTPLQTLTTTRSGTSWSVAASGPLADGTYTAKAQQSDAAGNTGFSAANTFSIDATPPALTLTAPANGSSSPNDRPTFAGAAGTAAGDSTTVTVNVYPGPAATGTPVQTLSTTRSGAAYSVTASSSLTPGIYTAKASQSDAAGNTGTSSASTFTVTDPVLLAAGDIAECGGDDDEATARLLDQNPNATVAPLGDLAYDNGQPAEYTNCYDPTWGRAKARTRPVIGGHDLKQVGGGPAPGTGYLNYFAAQLAPYGPTANDPTKLYYSYDLGAWHVVVLNASCIDETPGCNEALQEQWLRNDLAAHANQCTLAMWHNARWSSGSIHGDDPNMQAFWGILYDNAADLVLVGHDHDYERFAPQDSAGHLDNAYGMREFVVGTGGYSHYPFATPRPNSEVRNETTFGVLKLTLHANSYDWQFLPVAGETFTDSGSGACHGAPPVPPGAPTVRSSATATGNNATSLVISKPTGTAQGDLLLALIAHQGGSSRNVQPPAGWTAVPSSDYFEGTNARVHAYYLRAGAAEPASYTFTLTGGSGQDMAGGILAISGVSATAPINASGGQSNGATASTSVNAPSITTTVPNTLLVFGAAVNVTAIFTPPPFMAEQWDVTTGGTYRISLEAATQALAAAGATGTRTALLSTSGRSVADLIAIAPP